MSCRTLVVLHIFVGVSVVAATAGDGGGDWLLCEMGFGCFHGRLMSVLLYLFHEVFVCPSSLISIG